jgi:hypothetical protein
MEDDEPLSRFAHLVLSRIGNVQDTKSMKADSLQIYQQTLLL